MKRKIIYIFTIFSSFLYICPVMAQEAKEFPKPLGDVPLQVLIGQIINTLLGFVGSLFLVIFIYGGSLWMLSGGSSEKVQKGKNILMWATIGLVIVFASYGIVKFIFLGLGR